MSLELAGKKWSRYSVRVSDDLDRLELRIDRLRTEVRRAAAGGDRQRASALRGELRDAQRLWDESLARLEADETSERARDAESAAGQDDESLAGTPAVVRSAAGVPSRAQATASERDEGRGSRSDASQPGRFPRSRSVSEGILPAREQVHQALTLLGVPAAPKLIAAVHDAFYPAVLAVAKLASLRRDEERSFRTAPYARPYYICAALSAEHLAPARGLLAVSTWPMRTRIIGPLSPRVDYLTAAIRIAQHCRDLSGDNVEARKLLWRFAANIPRAAASMSTMDLDEIAHAARAELGLHERADSEVRESAARRARGQLDDAEQLFGSALRLTRTNTAG